MKGVKLNKNADLNSYSYSKHGVEFDGHGSSARADDRKKVILILCKGPTDEF